MNFAVRMWAIVMGIFLAFVVFQLLIKPNLSRLALINTSNALQIQYQQYQNSVLVHMIPTGFWVWFDGRYVMIYGEPTGRLCTDVGYDPVYVYDVKTRQDTGYVCADALERVKEFYNQKKIPIQYIFEKKFDPNFNVYDMINLLSDRAIITIPKKSDSDNRISIS